MPYLIGITLLWAFSFSLIGVYLAGQVDAYFSALCRILLAFLIFFPFLEWRRIPLRLAVRLMGIGAVQLGLMYVFYYQSFLLLSVPEVLIFTIFTPVYITLLHDLLQRRFTFRYLLGALLAVAGAAVIRYDALTESYLSGFLVVQGANFCFAFGQVAYKLLMQRGRQTLPQHSLFGWFYFGAMLVAVIAMALFGSDRYPTSLTQWGILLWLGVGASGLGYYLWNKGATQVNAGTLAVMNNALVPAGLVVNLLIWNRDAELGRLLTGSGILLLSLAVTRPRRQAHIEPD